MVAHIYLPDSPRPDINKAHEKRDFLKNAYITISIMEGQEK